MPDMIAFFTHFGHKILLFLHFMFKIEIRFFSNAAHNWQNISRVAITYYYHKG